MKLNKYDGMYWAFYLVIMFIVFGNAKSFISAAAIMVLVVLISEVDHRHGYFKANRKKVEESK
jgi:hypothetical protein